MLHHHTHTLSLYHSHTHTHTRTHTYTHIQIHIHTRIHTHSHAQTHTQSLAPSEERDFSPRAQWWYSSFRCSTSSQTWNEIRSAFSGQFSSPLSYLIFSSEQTILARLGWLGWFICKSDNVIDLTYTVTTFYLKMGIFIPTSKMFVHWTFNLIFFKTWFHLQALFYPAGRNGGRRGQG